MTTMTEFTLFPTIYKLMFEFLSSFYAWLGLFLSVSTIMLGKMCKNEAGRMYKLIKIQQTKKIKLQPHQVPVDSFITNKQTEILGPATRHKLKYDSTGFSKDSRETKQTFLIARRDLNTAIKDSMKHLIHSKSTQLKLDSTASFD